MSIAFYWLGIMAVAFAAALALWITLVFRAGREIPRRPQESEPHREVVGGAFEAREGGRQVMPDPGMPLVPEQADRRAREHVQGPGQRR
ncbi:MAG TPA: hypothetical protein VHJ18_12710 [Streptosporangiaceae bacterium]|jgi:hypothetical protein|nr:hypothetical protein [Streptosporangiaceae bacterium]